MQNTNCGKDCPFVKCGLCESDSGCPNYTETVWVEANTQEKKLVKDCSPKRLQLQNDLQNQRIFALQEALDLQRNAFEVMGNNFGSLLKQMEALALEQKKANQIALRQQEQKELPFKLSGSDIEENGES
jgi:hypothetical protein